MARFIFTLLLFTARLVAGQIAACPNEVAIYNQQDRTMAASLSWFVVPVPKEYVIEALRESTSSVVTLQGMNLLPIPGELKFPVGMHPVLVSAGMNGDIRQGGLQLATGLMIATSMIPYVGIGSSDTPFNAPLVSYLAGVDDVTQGYVFGLIPSVVATIGGLLTRVGAFIPLKAPLQIYSDGSLGINSKWAQAPNPATGPGLYSEALILGNLGSVLSPRCQRNTVFFTNSTAQPTYRSGNVTLGPSAGASLFSAVLQKGSPGRSGFYQSVYGLSACAQTVGYGSPVVPLGEDCEKAAIAVLNTPGAL